MLKVQLNNFKKEIIKKIDDALIFKCNIRIAHPEQLTDTILELCKKYHKLEKESDLD